MMAEEGCRDLAVWTADEDACQAMLAILKRHQSMRARPIDSEVFKCPEHDGGMRSQAVGLTRLHQHLFRHLLVLFDHDGCGAEGQSPPELEREIEQRLAASGWEDRAAVIVIARELEIWVWSDSPEVDRVLRWPEDEKPLKQWLVVSQGGGTEALR